MDVFEALFPNFTQIEGGKISPPITQAQWYYVMATPGREGTPQELPIEELAHWPVVVTRQAAEEFCRRLQTILCDDGTNKKVRLAEEESVSLQQGFRIVISD